MKLFIFILIYLNSLESAECSVLSTEEQSCLAQAFVNISVDLLKYQNI